MTNAADLGFWGNGITAYHRGGSTTATALLRVILQADRSFSLQGKDIADVSQLTETVAAFVQGKPFAERRVFVQYDPAVNRRTRTTVMTALGEAGAIIAWAQSLASMR